MLARYSKRTVTAALTRHSNHRQQAMSHSSSSTKSTQRSTPLQFTRPSNWKDLAPEAPPGGITYAAQTKLPKLPVPSLQDTLRKLKETLQPIAWNEEEFQEVVKKIEAFGKEQGPELHKRLLQRDATSKHWLEEWWDDGGYLGYRDSVIINVSYYYGFDVPKPGQFKSPAERAAGIARAAMIFRQKLKQGLVPPEATKEGSLCMDTYRWMFDCCRVPGSNGLDWSTSYAVPGDYGISGHVIVIRKNRVWKIEAVRDGKILSTADFEKQIEHIYNNTLEEYPGVGILTASNRDVWAKDYKELASSTINSEIIKDIHSSAFIICLDDAHPKGPIQHSRSLWHGDVVGRVPVGLRNRWADKPLNFVVFDNAYAGLLGEHSVMDGTPVARMCDNILDWLEDPTFDHGTLVAGDVLPVPLDWEVSNATKEAIEKGDVAARELIVAQELGYTLTPYGKDAIKEFGVSPDSWAQMVVQLAYKRLIGDAKRQGATYEAATTRKFFKGRTEAIRVVSSESDKWVESMDNPVVGPVQRKVLFDAATRQHISRAKAAGQGLGVDRHLFGLKKLLKSGEEVPALFGDPVLARSSNWVLSTSAIFSKHFPVYGWGEVVPEGFGVAYMTGFNDRLQYTITSRKEIPNAQFIKEIERASQDVYDLHAQTSKSQKANL